MSHNALRFTRKDVLVPAAALFTTWAIAAANDFGLFWTVGAAVATAAGAVGLILRLVR